LRDYVVPGTPPNRHRRSERDAELRPRVRSIDSSARNLASRGYVGGAFSGVDRHSMSRRQNAAQPARTEACEEDCAEYSDRFLPGYDRGRLLGKGACAVVWLASPQGQTGVVAVKQVAKGSTGKKRSDTEAARRELMYGSHLFLQPGGEPKVSPEQYPGISHITRLLDSFETKRDIWLVMDYGGTCLTKMAYQIKGEFLRGERLYRVTHLPMLQLMKRDIRVLQRLLSQLISALCVLANLNIVHSDIKPDNILIEEDESGRLKGRFIDLGSAFTFNSSENLSLATPEYMPPEALESCASRHGTARLSLGASRSSLASSATSRKPLTAAAGGDPSAKLHRLAQPWSFDIWSLGAILLELSIGTPLWLSYKCRVADDQRANSASLGLFAVPGRDPEKIMQRQADALRQRGLHRILRDSAGVPLDNGGDATGLELLSLMLAWDPLARISPSDALMHAWLCASA